eukprot:scaffold52410_cov51-Phaeocystis_antarctica.AAC.3
MPDMVRRPHARSLFCPSTRRPATSFSSWEAHRPPKRHRRRPAPTAPAAPAVPAARVARVASILEGLPQWPSAGSLLPCPSCPTPPSAGPYPPASSPGSHSTWPRGAAAWAPRCSPARTPQTALSEAVGLLDRAQHHTALLNAQAARAQYVVPVGRVPLAEPRHHLALLELQGELGAHHLDKAEQPPPRPLRRRRALSASPPLRVLSAGVPPYTAGEEARLEVAILRAAAHAVGVPGLLSVEHLRLSEVTVLARAQHRHRAGAWAAHRMGGVVDFDRARKQRVEVSRLVALFNYVVAPRDKGLVDEAHHRDVVAIRDAIARAVVLVRTTLQHGADGLALALRVEGRERLKQQLRVKHGRTERPPVVEAARAQRASRPELAGGHLLLQDSREYGSAQPSGGVSQLAAPPRQHLVARRDAARDDPRTVEKMPRLLADIVPDRVVKVGRRADGGDRGLL